MKMKRFFTTSILAVTILSLPLSGCFIIDDAISECDEKQNQLDTEKRTFALGANVIFKDGVPASDWWVTFKYEKEYCSGDRNGKMEISPSSTTDKNGYLYSGYLRTYDYTNKKDRVYIEITAYRGDCILGKTTEIFRWEDVDEIGEHVLGQVVKTYDITINYNWLDYLSIIDWDEVDCMESDM